MSLGSHKESCESEIVLNCSGRIPAGAELYEEKRLPPIYKIGKSKLLDSGSGWSHKIDFYCRYVKNKGLDMGWFL